MKNQSSQFKVRRAVVVFVGIAALATAGTAVAASGDSEDPSDFPMDLTYGSADAAEQYNTPGPRHADAATQRADQGRQRIWEEKNGIDQSDESPRPAAVGVAAQHIAEAKDPGNVSEPDEGPRYASADAAAQHIAEAKDEHLAR